ncbi:M14 family metallopeptidase [Aureibaculum sp. 2210JD6-5]|uniref:M14 family metallopeptidase n=1 Tax=Aureibaculum sp. 2210JD6-5 TaxID=3103957 RepID=UPI002AACDFE8|nr:M14 family metallopeptidase [Aureibaculum sp. 2210JD6-5]MDY7396923.1 M14 family metallopeptidase [Aureibaculum sp. 2210JD6-5]
MRKTFLLFLLILTPLLLVSQTSSDFTTIFEESNGTETATYQQTVQFYTDLANTYSEIQLQEIGEADSGKPLHIVVLNPDTEFDFSKIKQHKTVLLINNGIHPGESDGIDATMMLFRDIAQGKVQPPKNVVLVAIPIYNVGGCLNRNSHSRTNQNGPKSYGFRGNARNYDLNRDFIKCDTKNARTFAKIFHLVQPDVFIDNHVSNGADYQYTLTHLFTQHNKLGGSLGDYIHAEMMPELEKKLSQKKWDITPYVNVFNSTPDKGFSQFMDYPRYSTGYTTLFNTLGMMVETHMLKPYKQRVEGTYELMVCMIEIMDDDADSILNLRKNYHTSILNQKTYPLDWEIDTTKSTTLNFKGFEGEMIASEITGKPRLKYNRTKPFTKEVEYLNYFKPTVEVKIPKGYVIPRGWHNIIELLKLNEIEMKPIQNDTVFSVEVYKITDYQTRKSAYEGHYPHYNTKVESQQKEMNFRAGDLIIKTAQPGIRYLLETLEPQAPDSFFNWNFFDTILQQKEGFSPYVWEDLAKKILDKNLELKKAFENKKTNDKDFANNWYAQLDWIHKQSDYYEKAHMVYPVYRF